MTKKKSSKKPVPEETVVNADGRTIFKLNKPFFFGEEEITQLELREPTGADIESMSPKPTLKDFMQMGAKMAEQPYSLIKKMHARDCMRLTETVADFLDDGQETGDDAK